MSRAPRKRFIVLRCLALTETVETVSGGQRGFTDTTTPKGSLRDELWCYTTMRKFKALWGARFRKPLADSALRFSSSIDLDKHLYREDIAGSIAHVRMLADTKLVTRKEANRIVKALLEIQREIERGALTLTWKHEDIHMAIETRLIEKLGPLGGKLHTGRSRNDQVALDERLYLRRTIDDIRDAVRQLQRVLLRKSRIYFDKMMPGYTHLQRAQPILISHHLLAYISMLERDLERLRDCRVRLNRSPLGAAALAGTSLPIDRRKVAKTLKFHGIVENSIDAVSDRDYLLEFTSACSVLMMHLSRLAEELVLWSSDEFGYITIDDAYTTGSSMMPQKKNPDIAELVRGKTGRVYGNLMNLLTMMKGLPLAYNRDMQEDKLPLFDTTATVRSSLEIFAELLWHTKFNVAISEAKLGEDGAVVTDLAEYLVMRGVPFREAYTIAGKIIRYCSERRRSLSELTADELRRFSTRFDSDALALTDPKKSIKQKRSAGSTSPPEVRKQIHAWARRLRQPLT